MNQFTKRKKTIKEKMFETYVLALLVVVVLFIGVNLTQTWQMVRGQVTDSMTQLSRNTAERVDDKIAQLARLSERIVFSADVRETFFEGLANASDAVEIYRQSNQLNSTLYGIIGPKLDFYHMNLIDMEGNRFAFGQEYNYKSWGKGLVKDQAWFSETVEKDGKLFIAPGRESQMNRKVQKVISLSRGFGSWIGGTIKGVVEIQITYDDMENLINSTIYPEGDAPEERGVVIFNERGELVYPYGPIGDLTKVYAPLLEKRNETKQESILHKNVITGKKEYIFFSDCETSGWQVLVIVPESILVKPITKVVTQILFLGCLMLFGIAVFSRRAAAAYSAPIVKLYDSVKGLTLQDLNAEYQLEMKSGVDELEQLNQVFNKMVLRLHESFEEVVESRNMEMHSKMLALQAQMNPHFLYNTLTVISIMADNNEKENVQWACRNLSDMLSYVSSEALRMVYIREEMAHTESYISLIKMRYMEDIQITTDVPAQMSEIQIPKLVIQPLVENAVKYATDTLPVWKIHLSGRIEENKWFIQVEDNGKGFSEEALGDIQQKIALIEKTGSIPELSLNGMGILNIYLRMHFYYREKAVFEIENSPGKGARITIGGLVEMPVVLST